MKNLELKLDKTSLRFLLGHRLDTYEFDEERDKEVKELLSYAKDKLKRKEYDEWKRRYVQKKTELKDGKEDKGTVKMRSLE